MHYLKNLICLIFTLICVVNLVGCDSGGDDGVSLGETATLMVDGSSETTFNWNISFAYNEEDGFCLATGPHGNGRAQPPFERTFIPDTLARSGCPPVGADTSDFSGVLANVGVPQGASKNLTVRLLSGGNEVAVANEPGEDGFWRVAAGDVPDLDVSPVNSFSK